MLVLWNQPALTHLEEIRNFVARTSDQGATALVDRLISRTSQLEDFPRSGPFLPGSEALEIRFLVEQAYRIVYVIVRDHVEILGIIHGKRSS